MEAEDFLELVYGEREAWVDLPAKVGEYWVPYHIEWPADLQVSRRIDASLRDGESLYFSVAQFANRGRDIADVLPIAWLWADLDEVHPSTAASLGYMPTLAIESSPGRYQALWKLSRELKPKVVERLNRALTYALGADKGGWDLTQVLRLPGTRNFKPEYIKRWGEAPRVRIMHYSPELIYDPDHVWKSLRKHVPKEELAGVVKAQLPRKPIPRAAKQLLFAGEDEVVEGERHAQLWRLNSLLAEAGLTPEEIFDLVKDTPWNKWRTDGIHSWRARLEADIRKAHTRVNRRAALERKDKRRKKDAKRKVDKNSATRDQHRGRDEPTDVSASDAEDDSLEDDGEHGGIDRLPFVSYSSFMAMAMDEPKWLIRDIWTAESHGVIGGEPKTSKTTIALAAGLSVASGMPFLGKYDVGSPGSVLMVQEENAPWMVQDRLRKLAAEYGLISRRDVHVREAEPGGLGSTVIDVDLPSDVPMRLLNNYGFDLSVEEHRDMLEAEVDELRPRLLILDPMYLIFGAINANQMGEVQPFLKWIIQLRFTYGCAVMLVHHMSKKTEGNGGRRAGQRLMGSGTLHGFTDSALYTSRLEDDRPDWTKVEIETEFRSMPPQRPLQMAWHFDKPGSLDMSLEIGALDLERVIADLVSATPGITANQLSDQLGLDRRTILQRVRGGEIGMVVVAESRGRGKSLRVYMPSDAPEGVVSGEVLDDA